MRVDYTLQRVPETISRRARKVKIAYAAGIPCGEASKKERVALLELAAPQVPLAAEASDFLRRYRPA